jgi:hypothetical protein
MAEIKCCFLDFLIATIFFSQYIYIFKNCQISILLFFPILLCWQFESLFEQIELLEFSISSKSKKLQLAERRPSLQTKKKKCTRSAVLCWAAFVVITTLFFCPPLHVFFWRSSTASLFSLSLSLSLLAPLWIRNYFSNTVANLLNKSRHKTVLKDTL